MGNGIVQKLKDDGGFEIDDHWLGFEIHPETPAGGTDLSERFSGANMGSMYQRLQNMAQSYGLEMNVPTVLSNSHLALEASEFARDHGQFEAMHEYLFHAYFTEGKDIGDLEVLREGARQCHLDSDALAAALDDHRYHDRLEQAMQDGRRHGVTGTPTFIINNQYRIVGAQPYDSFVKALEKIQSEAPA